MLYVDERLKTLILFSNSFLPILGNFGDMLGPDIVKRIVENKFGCSAKDLPVVDFENKKNTTSASMMADADAIAAANRRPCCLWTVGSVWRNIRPNDHVWGSGALGNDWEFDGCYNTTILQGRQHSNITIYSTRGPKSLDSINRLCSGRINVPKSGIIEPRGDAGFLIPYIFPEYKYDPTKADKAKCVIAHYVDIHVLEKKLTTQKNNFPVKEDDCFPVVQSWQTMVGNMTRCKVLVSSSLHGIIVADAFGIPVAWKRSFHLHPYKYEDYFWSFPHGHWNNSYGNYGFALRFPDGMPKPIPPQERFEYAQGVIKSFPYHLFETITV